MPKRTASCFSWSQQVIGTLCGGEQRQWMTHVAHQQAVHHRLTGPNCQHLQCPTSCGKPLSVVVILPSLESILGGSGLESIFFKSINGKGH